MGKTFYLFFFRFYYRNSELNSKFNVDFKTFLKPGLFQNYMGMKLHGHLVHAPQRNIIANLVYITSSVMSDLP